MSEQISSRMDVSVGVSEYRVQKKYGGVCVCV